MSVVISNVIFMKSDDDRFTWEAHRPDVHGVVAWVSVLPGDVEVHNRVSVEHYSTLEEAARAIEQYG